MIALLFATRVEAAPFLAAVAATPVETDAELLQLHGHAWARLVAISGMGGAAARTMVARLAAAHPGLTTVVNAGICGATGPGLAVGELRRVERVRHERPSGGAATEHRLPPSRFPALAALPGAALATVDQPLFDAARRDALARTGSQLVDMEGFALAAACAERGLHLEMLKGVSDFADGAGKAALHANLAPVCARLAAFLHRLRAERPPGNPAH